MAFKAIYGGRTELIYDTLKRQGANNDIQFVSFATNLFNLKVEIQKKEPEVILISLMNDGWKVPELCKFRDSYYPNVRIVVYTMVTKYFLEAISQGVDGYLYMYDATIEDIQHAFICAFTEEKVYKSP
jgi:DNA-binding NarL/FixJ family response regulator